MGLWVTFPRMTSRLAIRLRAALSYCRSSELGGEDGAPWAGADVSRRMEEGIASHVGLRDRSHVFSMLFQSGLGLVCPSLESGERDLTGSVMLFPFLQRRPERKAFFVTGPGLN